MHKPALSISDQISRLESRGLVIDDAERLRLGRLLINCSYYRLSGYWRYFQRAPHRGDDAFRSDATFAAIEAVYSFDETLRSILNDGLSVLEVALRSRMAYTLATELGPYCYLEPATYSAERNRYGELRAGLLQDVSREINRSKEDFISHHVRRDRLVPIWAAVEALSFGTVSKMYRLVINLDVKHKIARTFDLAPERCVSAMRAFSVFRNVCAHHGRVWNRVPTITLQVPRKLKTDPDKKVYDQTPWGLLVTLAWLVDNIRHDASFSAELWNHVEAFPEWEDGLKRPHRR